MLVARPCRQGVDHIVNVDPAPVDRVGELIQHVQGVLLLGKPSLDLLPAFRGSRSVIIVGSGFAAPGPSGAHLVPLDRSTAAGCVVQFTQRLEGSLLADSPSGGFDELEDAYRPALVPAAQRQTERCG